MFVLLLLLLNHIYLALYTKNHRLVIFPGNATYLSNSWHTLFSFVIFAVEYESGVCQADILTV